MPSAAATTRSSGVVMNPRTRSALAPTYAVVTVTAAFSLRGYCRTFSVRIAWMPAMRMRRLTTSARTGRRMKMSVNFMRSPGRSLVHRLGRHLGVRRQLVVHHHRGVVAELESPAADDGLSGRESGGDGDQIAAPLSEADELLVRDQRRAALVVLLLLDGEDRVAKRR